MSMQDPISDMLTRVRNGQMAHKTVVAMPSSKVKVSVAKVLKDEGYISDYTVEENGAKAELSIELKYFEGKPVIEEIDRISSPGLRRYVGQNDLPTVRGGLGISIISTSDGVMTGSSARAKNIGGEILCTVF